MSAGERPTVVTGGAGFIGCNLADRLAARGGEVIVYDRLSRPGVAANLAWLQERHGGRIVPVIADVRDDAELRRAVAGAGAVFHLAAQVAVTTSLEDPRGDFEVNALGTLNVLEAARRNAAPTPVIFASTNKVYGSLGDVALTVDHGRYWPTDGALAANGIGEVRPLDFHTPYGCSKGAADQYVLDYARSFGLPAAVIRMSCIYGERQLGTEDQGWVAHFLIQALKGRPITIYGDGFQVRDILNVGDAVDAYVAALARIGEISGRAFNLGGGPVNAVSLLELVAHIDALIGAETDLRFEDWRAGDQRYFVADTRAARGALGLAPPAGWKSGVAALARWLAGRHSAAAPAPRAPVAAGAAS